MTDQTQGASEAGADTGAGNEGVPSAAEIMAFDPFAPPAEKTTETPQPTPAPVTPKPTDAPAAQSGKTAPAAPVVPDPNAPPVPPVTPPASNSTADLERLIREQTATIQAALPKPADVPIAEPPPKYNLALPPQVLGLLRSEDQGEFQQGMHAVINGIANKLWSDVSAHLNSTIQELTSQKLPQIMEAQRTATTTREQVATDFFGTHAHLNIPALKPLIQNVGLQVAQARMARGASVEWSPELRDEIAEAVHTALPQLRPADQQQQQQQPAPGKKPPFAAGGGTRPAAGNDATSEFVDMLK
jgi:hypothetical protein